MHEPQVKVRSNCPECDASLKVLSIISGNIQGQTETLTLYVSNQFANFNTVGAYMGGLVLAVISLLVLGLLSLSKRKETRSWRSKSAESPSDSETL